MKVDRKLLEKIFDALVRLNRTGDTQVFDLCDAPEIIPTLHAALAEPQSEEPYWYVDKEGKYYSSNDVKVFCDAETKALYNDPPPWRLDKGDLLPLYTHPSRWQTLSEDELTGLWVTHTRYQEESMAVSGGVEFARAVEEALRAKNFTPATSS